MACGTFTITSVAQADVQQTLEMFRASTPAPTRLTSEADGSGTFTVTAVFPDCPPNTSHDPSGSGPANASGQAQ